MLRSLLSVVLAGALVGCASSSPPLAKAPSDTQRTQLAAYAASISYPRDTKPSSDLQLAAVVDASRKTLTLRNYSDKQLRSIRVWINGDYVRQVDVLPAHGAVVISKSQFYNSAGLNLAGQTVSIQSVQVQDGDTLYTVQGPQMR